MLRHSSEQPNDIIFEAEEDLYYSPSREIVMLKGSVKSIQITKNRMFQSYVNEFCGMSGLASNALKFMIEKREINPTKIVNGSFSIKVSHTHEFHNAPNNSLKPALKTVLDNGFCSDLKLIVQGKEIKVHKCILAVRSPKFSTLITPQVKEIVLNNVIILFVIRIQGNYKIFRKLLVWIYSGDLEVPDDILDTIELYYLAQEYEVKDLMWRCEEEIILKISPSNVVRVLVKYYPSLNKDMKDEEEKTMMQQDLENPLQIINTEETQEETKINLQQQNSQQTSYKSELSLNILNTCKTVFIKEFQEVVACTPDLEQKLASVKGLIIELFSHINEVKSKKKKNKVRFSFVEEIHTPISFDHHLDNTDTHSENSIRI